MSGRISTCNDVALRIREAYLTHVRARFSITSAKGGRTGISYRCIHDTYLLLRLIETTSRRAIIGPINLPRVVTRGAVPHARGLQ